jgi:hypothetical protein
LRVETPARREFDRAWNSRAISVLSGWTSEAAMLVERNVQLVNVEIVGEAYEIAANYLKKTGAMADSERTDERLLEIIYKMFNAGDRNRLWLANRAISKFQRQVSMVC